MSHLKDILHRKYSLRRKMLLQIFIALLFVLGAIFSYIIIKSERLAVSNAHQLADSYASGYARYVQDKLNTDMGMARAFGESLYRFLEIPPEQRLAVNKKMMFPIAEKNPEFLAVWTIWERRTFDSTWNLPYGRGRYTVYKQNNQLKYREELLDLDGDNVDGAYYKMKVSKEETVLNPYTFSYSGKKEDEILETSLCMPILKEGEFVGLAGMDVSLESYQDIVNEIEPIEGSRLYLIANNSTFVTNPNEEYLGKPFAEAYENVADSFNIEEIIKEGQFLSFRSKGEKSYFYVFSPIQIGETSQPWSMMLRAPLSPIMREAERNVIISILVGLLGLTIMMVTVWIIAINITRPVKYTTRVLQKLAKGNLDNISKLNVKSGDELQDMADSLNTLMDGLQNTAEFAREIGKGSLNSEYQMLSENDTLGNALLDMQSSLKRAQEEEEKRKKEEVRQNWTTEGLAKFGDILRKNNDNLKELSFNIMKNLVEYTGAAQGCVYVRSENEEQEEYQLTSAIAFDRRKMLKETIQPGDGLVGRVVHEKLTIYMTDVPEDYVHITSGLGRANPRSILIVPLVLNDEVFGALELVSFKEFEDYEIQFVEKIGESIASTVSSVKVTERTNRLLKESQNQREELSSQEEEMRQNLEELKATQEEASRRDAERNALIEALGSSVLITEFDLEGKVLNVNQKCSDLLGIQPEKMLGKYHRSLGLDNTTSDSAYRKLWSDLKRGKQVKRISQVTIAGHKKYLEETYIPIADNEGNIHKIVAVGYDYTKIKDKENEVAKLQEEIKNMKEE